MTVDDPTAAHRELLEHICEVDDELAPIAEEILAEIGTME